MYAGLPVARVPLMVTVLFAMSVVGFVGAAPIGTAIDAGMVQATVAWSPRPRSPSHVTSAMLVVVVPVGGVTNPLMSKLVPAFWYWTKPS